MRIFKVALGLKKLTALLLIQLAQKIINMMTGNVSVPVASPTLVVLQGKLDDYVAAKAALEMAKSTLGQCAALEKQKRKLLEEALTDEGRTVDSIAHGDKAIIESCGMPASDQPNPVHMGQVEELALTRGDAPQSVDAHWHAIPEAANYTIEITYTAPDIHGMAPWVFYGNSSKSSALIKEQTSGSNLWVHVCANGSGQEKGAFSDPAMLIVP